MKWERFSLKVRRRETPFYDFLFKVAFHTRHFEFPVIPGVHHLLYYERNTRQNLWRHFLRILYYEPLFKTRCIRVGKKLYIEGPMPIVGGHVRLIIGDNAWIMGGATFAGNRFFDNPSIILGDNCIIGWSNTIVASNEVRIGNNFRTANFVFISSHMPHPVDPILRRPGGYHRLGIGKPERLDEKSIVIEDDVGIARAAMVLAPVTIGRGALIAAGAVVTKDVPPYTLFAGNPGKIVKKLQIPEQEIERISAETYQKYLDAKIEL